METDEEWSDSVIARCALDQLKASSAPTYNGMRAPSRSCDIPDQKGFLRVVLLAVLVLFACLRDGLCLPPHMSALARQNVQLKRGKGKFVGKGTTPKVEDLLITEFL